MGANFRHTITGDRLFAGKLAGGVLLAAPGSFFRRFRKRAANGPARPDRPQAPFPDRQWLVTYERANGDVASAAVLINGGNLQADIEALARLALHDQHDIDGATILRIQLDLRATPASVELLACITRNYNARARFEAECG